MERLDHYSFELCPKATLSDILSDKRKHRLATKVATIYQELSDVALRSLAVLSALNASDGEVIKTDHLMKCAKFGSRELPSIRNLATETDFINVKYLSREPFIKLLKRLDSAESCLKVHCSSKLGGDEVSGDQITRMKIRWTDLATDILNCIIAVRTVGAMLHGPSEQTLNSSLETWLNEVRSGGSLLDDPRGPLSALIDKPRRTYAAKQA